MPVGTPIAVGIMPAMISVPAANGLMININVQSDGSPEGLALIPETVQEIVDLFQGWSGLVPQSNVQGQLYDTTMSVVDPTNPVILDPPEPPPGE
jgi:hypothetical protein